MKNDAECMAKMKLDEAGHFLEQINNHTRPGEMKKILGAGSLSKNVGQVG